MALMATSIGLAFGFTLLAASLGANPEAEASRVLPDAPDALQLAQAFTAALNAHDSDALIDLFTEEDAGPMVSADRFAWQKFEIRLWARQQIEAGIQTEAYAYRLSERGASWKADVYRADWNALGLPRLRVTNSIWVHHGRLAGFTSQPIEPGDVMMLGRLWQPGTTPEHPTTYW